MLMNVSLTDELESLVQEKVRSGMYGSASEVVREALRLLRERDETREARLARLREDVAIGVEQAERGETRQIDVDRFKAEARARLKARR